MDYTVLVVEDDEEIRKGIAIYLKNQGYQVLLAANGKEGLELLDKNTVHLAIVDVMMPVMDGISMVMQLRQTYEFPVIFLSARSEDMDKITGLNIGADDYVTKPFVPLELLAQSSAALRRYQKFLQLSSQNQPSHNLYVVGGLELDEETATVSVDGEVVKLTPMEYKILLLLMQNPGRVFPAEEIYQRVWNERAVNTDTVMVHLRNLRSKIEFDPKNPKYVKVVWGIGYKIEKI